MALFYNKGYLILLAQLPDGASLQRTDAVREQLSTMIRKIPGVAHTVEIVGLYLLDVSERTNTLTTFITLKPFEERENDPAQSMTSILAAVRQEVSQVPDALVLAFPPPPVLGIGTRRWV